MFFLYFCTQIYDIYMDTELGELHEARSNEMLFHHYALEIKNCK